jgi:hypothetical protein
MQLLKKQAVEYKGNKCSNCNYDKCVDALEFHHVDQSQKDFNIGHLKFYKWCKRITDELDKCVLLCANCHREKHYELRRA